MSEKQIQNAILRAYGTRGDMRLWRQNTGAAMLPGANGGQMVRFGLKGQADLSGILPGGVRLEIEVKAAAGRQRPDQQAFQRMITKFGGVYVLARSVADVDRALAPYLEGGR